jgi:protein-tyrosine phosphatase
METIPNFRDCGGYKTQSGLTLKKGVLYRSGSLAKASDNDLRQLAALGLKTVCDLRTLKEKSRGPDRIPGNGVVKSIHLPIKVTMHNESGFVGQLISLSLGQGRRLNYNNVAREMYQEYVTGFCAEFSQVIKLATDSRNLPLLIHCTAGKDRTGFACSLIQLLLGVPFEVVMQDYLLSNDYLRQFKIDMLNNLKLFAVLGVPVQRFLPLFEARRDYLTAAVEQIQHDYGAIEDYARQGLGLSDDDRTRLNELLLEEVSSQD